MAREAVRVEIGVIDTLARATALRSSAADLDGLARLHARSLSALSQVERAIRNAEDTDVPPSLGRNLSNAIGRFDTRFYSDLMRALKQPQAERQAGPAGRTPVIHRRHPGPDRRPGRGLCRAPSPAWARA